MKKKALKQRLDKLWKTSKKDLDKVLRDASYLAQKGEEHIKEISKKGEKNLEVMLLSLQKEKLYYELGKSLAGISKGRWGSSKKIDDCLIKIKNISRKVKSLKKSS